MTFKKSEIRYIIYAIIFAAGWFVIALPYIIKTFNGNTPYTQFIFFNVGLIIFFQIFLKSITTSSKISITTSIGLIGLFLALDTIAPEYHVSLNGSLIPGEALLSCGTTDYIWGLFGTSIGLTGILIYLFTYLFMPFLLLLIAAKLIPDFVKTL